MRALFAAVSLLALGSCNELITRTAMFSRADAVGAPPMRSGVWRAVDADNQCVFDSKKPVTSWPGCASPTLVIDGTFATYQGKNGHKELTPLGGALLVNGEPMILQFSPTGDPRADDQAYGYAAVRVTKRDDQGRIVGYSMWEVGCGPPPSDDAKKPDGSSGRSGTTTPLPGLVMDKDGNDCSATSPQAIRDAAAASEKWTPPLNVVWVRDGDI